VLQNGLKFTNQTGLDGVARFYGLVEGIYGIYTSADTNHVTKSDIVTVVGGTTTQQLVRMWTVSMKLYGPAGASGIDRTHTSPKPNLPGICIDACWCRVWLLLLM
jgi:hypothetical protein